MRTLLADAIARRRLVLLTPGKVSAAICRWQGAGLSVATISVRWLVLRSAVSWAVAEGIMRSSPLVGMRGPARPQPRRHHTLGEVRQVLAFVEANAARIMGALAADWESGTLRRSAFIAEQDHLLVRLAADSGARRGELAVLRYSDLDGRVLTIERGLSHGVLGSTKSARSRRLTLGATTAALVNSHISTWSTSLATRSASGCFRRRRPGRPT